MTTLNWPLLTRVGTLIKALVCTNLDKLKFENGLLWPQKTELFETLSRVDKFETQAMCFGVGGGNGLTFWNSWVTVAMWSLSPFVYFKILGCILLELFWLFLFRFRNTRIHGISISKKKKRFFWIRNIHGGGDLKTTMPAHARAAT